MQQQYGPSHVDLRIRIKFPIDDGPVRNPVIHDSALVNREIFMTQIILDISSSLETSPCKIYVIGVYIKGSGDNWKSENVIITFRIFPLTQKQSQIQASKFKRLHPCASVVANTSKQIQTTSSTCFSGKITRKTDKLLGLVALKWRKRFIELPQHEWYLNQGSLQSCFFESNAGSLHCRFDRDLIDDTRQ
ncbi:hypothetical protein ACHAW6_007738 [Cyclotella cf. meneghiniana]